jgi:hypothetical protein
MSIEKIDHPVDLVDLSLVERQGRPVPPITGLPHDGVERVLRLAIGARQRQVADGPGDTTVAVVERVQGDEPEMAKANLDQRRFASRAIVEPFTALHASKVAPITATRYAVFNRAIRTTATVSIGSTKPITITVTSSMPSSL